MSNREECAAYFREHPEWKRCFELMRKKWESYGRTGGSIVLKQAAEEERRAVERVLGKMLSKEKVSFSLRDFEAALQRTKYAPITLKELLDAYFEEEIQTKQERAEQCRNSRQRFWEQLIKSFTEKQGKHGRNSFDECIVQPFCIGIPADCLCMEGSAVSKPYPAGRSIQHGDHIRFTFEDG